MFTNPQGRQEKGWEMKETHIKELRKCQTLSLIVNKSF